MGMGHITIYLLSLLNTSTDTCGSSPDPARRAGCANVAPALRRRMAYIGHVDEFVVNPENRHHYPFGDAGRAIYGKEGCDYSRFRNG